MSARNVDEVEVAYRAKLGRWDARGYRNYPKQNGFAKLWGLPGLSKIKAQKLDVAVFWHAFSGFLSVEYLEHSAECGGPIAINHGS